VLDLVAPDGAMLDPACLRAVQYFGRRGCEILDIPPEADKSGSLKNCDRKTAGIQYHPAPARLFDSTAQINCSILF
jgi:hypothetical protein